MEQERYRLGVSTIVDLLTSQEALNQAEVDVVNARFDYLRAKAQIEALMDGTCDQHPVEYGRTDGNAPGGRPPGCGHRHAQSPAGVRHGRRNRSRASRGGREHPEE